MTNDKNKKKEFSIFKWILFPTLTVILASIVAWFNISVFGAEDAVPYVAFVFIIGGFSIVINRYLESENKALARASFVFEVFLTLALFANALFCVSVQREMVMARRQDQAQSIESISKLRGSRNQSEALKRLDKTGGNQEKAIFKENERLLFWIMFAEGLLFIVAAFTMLGLAKLLDKKPEETQTSPEPRYLPAPAYVNDDAEWKPRIVKLNDRGKYDSH